MAFMKEFQQELLEELEDAPAAVATLKGSAVYPDLKGVIRFYQMDAGVLVIAQVRNLPMQTDCGGVFGFHIHEGTSCGDDDFAQTMGHYNPKNCKHPYHAGDLPPLFSNHGKAWMAVLTDRFSLQEIIGKTVVVHEQPDDFMSQPAGNSGRKIACGIIRG